METRFVDSLREYLSESAFPFPQIASPNELVVSDKEDRVLLTHSRFRLLATDHAQPGDRLNLGDFLETVIKT